MNTATLASRPDVLWQAVALRNADADGLFVYAVKSTGVYCRPSCPSRRPRRDRVEFFPAPAMAEAGGFRACRRCHPDQAIGGPPPLARVRRACEAVAARPDAPWTRATLAKAGGTTTVQLQRAFRSVLGLSPRDYVAACRRRRFLSRLRAGLPVTDAIYEAGYGSPSRVYGAIALPGMTPATYGRGGTGARIDWLTTKSSIGRILVAATERGLCFVEVGTTDRALQAELRREFPRAEIGASPSRGLRALADAARAAAEGTPQARVLPLDIRGTAFQWRVWRALTAIPLGETRSYAEVARAIGQPRAVRAVARACATNPIAVVVPCHRVIGADGSKGGYRWGADTKRRILRAEGAQ